MAAGRTEGLIKTYMAGGTVNPYRLVKYGSNDDSAVQASAASDKLIGVSRIPGGLPNPIVYGQAAPAIQVVTGQFFDVVMSDIAEVEYGGTVTRGDLLTSDANGKAIAITSTPAAGTRIIGEATVSGVSGDIGTVHIRKQAFLTTS